MGTPLIALNVNFPPLTQCLQHQSGMSRWYCCASSLPYSRQGNKIEEMYYSMKHRIPYQDAEDTANPPVIPQLGIKLISVSKGMGESLKAAGSTLMCGIPFTAHGIV